MPFYCGGLRLRQTEQKGRSLCIGSRLLSGQCYVSGGLAPFKMGDCLVPGIRGQRLFAR